MSGHVLSGLLPDAASILHAFGPWVLVGIALLVFIESGVLFPFLPGDSLLVTAAILAGPLGIQPWQVILVAVPAAILGDQVGYVLGRYFGRRLFKDDARVLRTDRLEETERFFARYGAPSLVLGRFIPIVRTFVPLVAGTARMPYPRFLLWNATGALLWVIGMTSIGLALGGIPFIVNNIDVLMIVIVVVSLLPVVIGALRKYRRSRSEVEADGTPEKRQAAPATRRDARPRTGIFRPAHRPLLALSVAVAAGVVVLALGFIVRGHPFDLGAVVFLNAAHVGAWGVIANGIYHFLSPVPAVILTAVLCAIVWGGSRSLRTAIAFGAVIALAWLPVAAFKIVVNRPRPDASVLSHAYTPAQVDGSFPSGHTAFVVALAFATWYLLRGTRWARGVVVVGVVAVGVTAAAVVSDGLHYPTDALAAIIWTLAMAPFARYVVVDLGLSRIPARARPAAASDAAPAVAPRTDDETDHVRLDHARARSDYAPGTRRSTHVDVDDSGLRSRAR